MTEIVFLEGLGFREPGSRLAAPASAEREGRRITVRQLVATPAATDLVYDFSEDVGCCVPWGSDLEKFERVALRVGDEVFGLGHGAMSTSVRPGRIERSISLRAIPSDARRVEVTLASEALGEWSIPVDLTPYPSDDDPRGADLGASDTRHGITITARAFVETPDRTIVLLEHAEDTQRLWVSGLGGLSPGMRGPSVALMLCDQTGRTYPERVRPDARDQYFDRTGRAEVAEFGPLADDARELELEVPFVCATDRDAKLEFDAPVTAPLDLSVGGIPVRVLGTERPDPDDRRHRGMAIGVRLDLGGWHGDRRVVVPDQPRLDGEGQGLGYGRGISGSEPTSLDYVTVATSTPDAPHHVSFEAATLQLRGPWRIRFTRPGR